MKHDNSLARLDHYDWSQITESLNTRGWALLPQLLTAPECDDLAGLYDTQQGFRSRVIMERHGFGKGEYKYFSYPHPDKIANLRRQIYPYLVPVANQWNENMNIENRFPNQHADFLKVCHQAGQTRPTPLLLKYQEQDYNCLHQDLYGDHIFPLQVVCLLSEPNTDYIGGEFIVTEQRPRMQTKATVIPLTKGDGAVFAVHHRPHQGTRGFYRVNMRHGISQVRSGKRYAMGIIFHDAI